MFSGQPQGAFQITQGTALHILNRKDMTHALATVTSMSAPHIPKAAQSNPALAWQGLVWDLTLSMGNETTTVEYPVNGASASYADKGWFISPDPLTVSREVEVMDKTSKQAISMEPWHHMVVERSGPLIIELNPERRKEAQQAQEIEMLKGQLEDMRRRSSESDAKLDRILESLSEARPANAKKKEE